MIMVLIARGKYVSDKIMIILVSIRTLTMIFLPGWCYWHQKLTKIILNFFQNMLKLLINIAFITILIASFASATA